MVVVVVAEKATKDTRYTMVKTCILVSIRNITSTNSLYVQSRQKPILIAMITTVLTNGMIHQGSISKRLKPQPAMVTLTLQETLF